MESLAAQPPEREKLKSFDLMASVDMMRFDIQREGRVLPETRQRVYDEELSSMAEGSNRASRTSFTFQRQNDELVYFDKGEWRPYIGLLITGLDTARCEEIVDYRRAFLHEWAVRDLAVGYDLLKLRAGQKKAWYSAYPQEVEDHYGAEFIKSCGLVPDRKMGFLYVATANEDGSVTLESQTVDRSETAALEAATHESSLDEDYDMNVLLRAYDGVLSKKYGGHFYAGRRNVELQENAWEDITRHSDLISFFLDGLERLAASGLSRPQLERTAKEHIIGTWKAFKNRLDAQDKGNHSPTNVAGLLSFDPIAQQAQLTAETRSAYRQAQLEGDIKISCGGTVQTDRSLDGKATFDSIFGENIAKTSDDLEIPKIINCIECKRPSPKEKVVKAKSWCCPHCKYEVDICNGEVIHESIKPKANKGIVAALIAELDKRENKASFALAA